MRVVFNKLSLLPELEPQWATSFDFQTWDELLRYPVKTLSHYRLLDDGGCVIDEFNGPDDLG